MGLGAFRGADSHVASSPIFCPDPDLHPMRARKDSTRSDQHDEGDAQEGLIEVVGDRLRPLAFLGNRIDSERRAAPVEIDRKRARLGAGLLG